MSRFPVEHAFVDAALAEDVIQLAQSVSGEALKIEHSNKDASKALPLIVKLFGNAKLLRYVVPASHGGATVTVSSTALCLMRERLGHFSPLLDLAFAMQGLGSYPITLAGTAATQAEWLPRVLRGESVAAFALTESTAGSDLGGIQTRATRTGDSYSLSGKKAFISNAGVADLYTVFAVTDESNEKRRLSCFVVPAKTKGLSVQAVDVLGAHPIGNVTLDNVVIPASHLLGAEGDGMRIALGTLERFRPTVGAAALGFAQRALDDSVAHVKSRVQFGKALAEQQLVQAHLADMACDVESSRLLVYRAAVTADAEKARPEIARTGSMAKLMSTEAAQRVIDCAVQLHGGLGVTTSTHVARLYQDIRALRIYEGTTEIQKLLIAREVLRS